jgi:hypothetical protein
MIDASKVRFLTEDDGVREGRLITGQLGEYIERMFAAAIPADWTLEKAQWAIDELIEPEHCSHAHDCCGRFYGGWADVIAETFWDGEPNTKVIWIKRGYSQNI